MKVNHHSKAYKRGMKNGMKKPRKQKQNPYAPLTQESVEWYEGFGYGKEISKHV